MLEGNRPLNDGFFGLVPITLRSRARYAVSGRPVRRNLVGLYSLSIVILFFLDTLGFDYLFTSTAADLGVYTTAGSIVFVSC